MEKLFKMVGYRDTNYDVQMISQGMTKIYELVDNGDTFDIVKSAIFNRIGYVYTNFELKELPISEEKFCEYNAHELDFYKRSQLAKEEM